MDIAIIAELISTIGFPIALVVVLMWFIFKLQNESVAREERLMKVIEEYGKKLAEISSAINAINDKIDRYHSNDNA